MNSGNCKKVTNIWDLFETWQPHAFSKCKKNNSGTMITLEAMMDFVKRLHICSGFTLNNITYECNWVMLLYTKINFAKVQGSSSSLTFGSFLFI
jgi:hypothetical protein